MRASRILASLGSILLIVLITILLAEVTLRAYHWLWPSFIFYDRSYNRFRSPPFAPDFDNFRLNSKGFKDQEFLPKNGSRFRIIAVGDSFAYGVVPYRHNFLTVLEDKLNERFPAEIYNLGIPGIGPKDYLSVLIHEGLPLQPDLVLLSFFIGNDFRDARATARKWWEYSYVASLGRYVHVLFKHTMKPPVAIENAPAGVPGYDDSAPTFTRERFLDIETEHAQILRRGYARFPEMLNAAARYLEEFKRVCDAYGVPLVVVVAPTETQASSVVRAEVMRASRDTDETNWDFTLPNRALARRLAASNVVHIDLYDAFVAASRERNLYKPNDSHWNIAGNRFAADLIESYLLERQAIPSHVSVGNPHPH
jgi:hypothetical protein